jgi:hypothetical protein
MPLKRSADSSIGQEFLARSRVLKPAENAGRTVGAAVIDNNDAGRGARSSRNYSRDVSLDIERKDYDQDPVVVSLSTKELAAARAAPHSREDRQGDR